MKILYLLSQCVSSSPKKIKFFHFNGIYNGEKISRICLTDNENIFEIKEVYLIKIQVTDIKKGILSGAILDFKAFGSFKNEIM